MAPAPFRERNLALHPLALTPKYRSSIYRSPREKKLTIGVSASEMTGPVFGHDIIGPNDNDMIKNYARPGETAIGERILVHGRVQDEDGRGVIGTLIEFWQANAGGRYRHVSDTYLAQLDPNFGGCGRTITGEDGSYMLRTIKPGPYPFPNGPNDWRPSHIHFSVFGHGFVQRLITQMYFEGDPLIKLCPIVSTIPQPQAIDRLVSRYDPDNTVPMDTRAYRFDIILRGHNSTPFENHLDDN